MLADITGLGLSKRDILLFESMVPHVLGCCETGLVVVIVYVFFYFYAPQIASSCKYGDSKFDPDPFTEIARDSMPNPIVKSRLQRRENGQDQVFPDKFFSSGPYTGIPWA